MQETLQNSSCPKLVDPRHIWEEMLKFSLHSPPTTSSGKPPPHQAQASTAHQLVPDADFAQLTPEIMEDFDPDSDSTLICLLDGISLLWGSHGSQAGRVTQRKVVEGQRAVVEAMLKTSSIKV